MKHNVEDGFLYYRELVEGSPLSALFYDDTLTKLLSHLDDEKANYSYAPGKWTIKEVVGHITDHERIMIYRLLRLSRKDPTPLPGYDQDLLISNSRFNELPLSLLLTDYNNVRASTKSFIATLSQDQLSLIGNIWKYQFTIQDYLKATAGHELHHIEILKKWYL